jgi:drug/metabolite transporter (DMT)-like permease
MLKICLEKIDVFNLLITRYIFSGIFALIIVVLNYKKTIKNISNHKNIYLILLGLSITTFIASASYYYLLNKYNANFISIILSPISILLTAVIGRLFFNEPLTNQMWLGAFIIIIGLGIFINGKN